MVGTTFLDDTKGRKIVAVLQVKVAFAARSNIQSTNDPAQDGPHQPAVECASDEEARMNVCKECIVSYLGESVCSKLTF